jgi:hypothetical protein
MMVLHFLEVLAFVIFITIVSFLSIWGRYHGDNRILWLNLLLVAVAVCLWWVFK